ncbi:MULTISPECIES: YgcG family protein [Aerococcus]|uniref:TPM domain-containing protein n=1 Tax=Aerococcus TaxID=1375 RepID=UPI00143CB3BC|nr:MULTISPECIES: TPM domain-containing protein [Aerococcus]MDK6370166.1 TPM domain-containing protein [Aerococcus sp. UMB9870]MDK6680290.1 TPM domain-containing protein [Aerococcus sp. UMB8608]MDK6686870.1 TPM domain-containing protein [Aerococcus sp. UMB8623]
MTLVLAFITGQFYFWDRTYKEPAYPEISQEYYVSDYSHALSDFTKTHIISEGEKLDQATDTAVLVVSLPTTEKLRKERYSQELMDRWGIDKDKPGRWALLLFKTNSHYSSEPHLNEDPYMHLELAEDLASGLKLPGKAGQTIETYAGDIKDGQNNYDQAAYDGFNALARELYQANQLPVPESLTLPYEEALKAPENQALLKRQQMQTELKQAESEVRLNPEPLPIQLGKAFLVAVGVLVAVFLICMALYYLIFGLGMLYYFIRKVFGYEDLD